MGIHKGGYIDSDAQAFVIAAGLTDKSQIYAVGRLVADLKGKYNRSYSTTNVWDKMQVIYPFVGGNAISHAVNLKTPGTYNITYYGSVTHSLSGVRGNKTISTYADTNFYPKDSSTLNDMHISAYARGVALSSEMNDALNQDQLVMGTYLNAGYGTWLGFWYDPGSSIGSGEAIWWTIQSNGNYNYVYYNSSSLAGKNAQRKGYHIASRDNASSVKWYYNGNLMIDGPLNSATIPSNAINYPFYLLAGRGNNANPVQLPSNEELGFATIGKNLNSIESLSLYNSIQNYQTLLNRQV